jgi:predicted nucleic acid-binding Zn ribbon protein
MNAICKWCGKEFDAPNSKVKYCSDYCRKKRQYAYEKEFYKNQRASRPKPVKVCMICGKEFSRTNENRKFCSDECRKEQARRQSKKFYHQYKQEEAEFFAKERERAREYYLSVGKKRRQEEAQRRKAEQERIDRMIDDVYQPEYEHRELDGKVLHKAEMTVDEYNRTHGTNYSYGQYVHYVERNLI